MNSCWVKYLCTNYRRQTKMLPICEDPVGCNVIPSDIQRKVSNIVNQLHVARFRRSSLTFEATKPEASIAQSSKRRQDTLASSQMALECAKNRMECEDACALLHNDWLKRNQKFATGLQKYAYVLLTDQEKSKYRNVYLAACACYNEQVTISYIS